MGTIPSAQRRLSALARRVTPPPRPSAVASGALRGTGAVRSANVVPDTPETKRPRAHARPLSSEKPPR